VTDPSPAVAPQDAELTARVERALTSSYELGAEMGRGGMGIVYRARDRRLKRWVAVKVLPPELAYRAEIRSRFLREAETAAQLTHPHIVPIYSVDEADGIVYFAMACVDGENLGRRIHTRGPMPVDDVRRILAEVSDALAYAHARGVVHRDIKPDNILLDKDGDRAMVSDFGIARAIIDGADSRLTATGMAIGTPAFMSPEQSAGDREVDGRSDLYSLGVVAYQMLAGELPFQATSTPAMLVKHLSERPTPVDQRRPDCPPDLAAIVMRLLEKEPAQRFNDAEELEGALLGTRPVAPPSYATTQPPRGALPPAPLPPGPAATTRGVGVGRGGLGVAVASGPDARERARELAGLRPVAAPWDAGARGLVGEDTGDTDLLAPEADELARWRAPQVADFRRKLGWFAIVGSVMLFMSVFANAELFGPLGIWAVFLAYKYAKLWSDGFSWHDVLRQPRERLFADVAAEWGEDVHAIIDPAKRARVRERQRRRRLRRAAWDQGAAQSPGGAAGALGAGAPGWGPDHRGSDYRPDYARGYGGYAGAGLTDAARGATASAANARVDDAVRQSFAERDEIVRILATMPKGERERVADVGPSARALADRAQALAVTLAQLDRDAAPGAADVLEAEIGRLESEANPLDRAASDDRVKRLAYLKRQRRAVAEHGRRRAAAAEALEHCRVALETMRVDLVRLRTGGASPAQVTTLAERAQALAREVDGIVSAASEVARATAPGGPPAGGGPAGGTRGGAAAAAR
jgi:serine/threonine-protein kinase